ncbi:hypothetical protein UY3_07511 [Chelonia mydas]|uniref:Uncharacterized protein n=1 Tax=Chelonia mydas TaxID=8469 RepID=M7BDW0_CHEMY|nr:hypothetical protein UY3_07511 [Chelonia mydas]
MRLPRSVPACALGSGRLPCHSMRNSLSRGAPGHPPPSIEYRPPRRDLPSVIVYAQLSAASPSETVPTSPVPSEPSALNTNQDS